MTEGLLPKTRRARRSSRSGRVLAAVVLAAVGVAGTLGVAGCAGAQPGAAAVVNGTTISEDDIDAVAGDLQPYVQPGQSVPRQNVLTALIMRPFIADRLKVSGKMISLDQAAQALHQAATQGQPAPGNAPGPGEWSKPTKELAQAQLGIEALSPADRGRVADAIAKAKITVNPRYGEFQLPGQIVPPVDNWIDAKATPGPTQTQPAPQQTR